jgi:hypothetical protein
LPLSSVNAEILSKRPRSISNVGTCSFLNLNHTDDLEDFDHICPYRTTDFSMTAGRNSHSERGGIYVNDRSNCNKILHIQLYQCDISVLKRPQKALLSGIINIDYCERARQRIVLIADDGSIDSSLEQWCMDYANEYCHLRADSTRLNKHGLYPTEPNMEGLVPDVWVSSFIFGSYYASAGLLAAGVGIQSHMHVSLMLILK